MAINYIVFIFCMIFSASAAEHSLAAHEHGSLKLSMAIEKNVISFEIDGPAESFLGFEYAPKTEKEKKVFDKARSTWEKDFLNLVTFDPKLGCVLTQSSFKQVLEGTHSDIEASSTVTCAREIKGSELKISLRKYYDHIKKLVVDVIGTEILSIQITRPVQSFKI